MEGHLRFFFGQFIFISYILTLISISIIKKNFLGHTDNLTYGNDTEIFFKKSKNREFTEIKKKRESQIYRDFRKKKRDLGKLPRNPITVSDQIILFNNLFSN
jgi:hypothetical protein